MKILRNIIIIIELSVIIIVLFFIYSKVNKNKNVLGSSTAFVTLNKDDYIASASGDLKYYYEPKPNSRILENQPVWLPKKVAYTINLDTLNERYDYDLIKSERTFRIITLGDSFTYGLFVNTPDNWTELLENKLNTLKCPNINKFEVINLAVAGYGPEYIKERYKIRGKKYNPDLIIWFESGAGFERVNELFMPLIKKYESNLTAKEIEELNSNGIQVPWHKAIDEMGKKYGHKQLFEIVSKSWSEFYKLRENTPVLVSSMLGLLESNQKLLEKWSNGQTNVDIYFDIPNVFENDLSFPDGHPNEIGHKAIAESTFNYLLNNFIRDCTNEK
jgi:hypothetical protein